MAVLCGAVAGCDANGSVQAAAVNAPTSVERGKYLVQVVGCGDCHTPKKMGPNGPEPDLTRALSGHPEQEKMPAPTPGSQAWPIAVAPDLTAWSGPWGESFAANLTPDQNTGLGIWTEDMFLKAIRTGKHMGTSRPILPPMPWADFAQMSDADLKAIYAYLRTIKPIVNHVPEPVPPAAHR
jgi:mono/diheme cytochrome c family protein